MAMSSEDSPISVAFFAALSKDVLMSSGNVLKNPWPEEGNDEFGENEMACCPESSSPYRMVALISLGGRFLSLYAESDIVALGIPARPSHLNAIAGDDLLPSLSCMEDLSSSGIDQNSSSFLPCHSSSVSFRFSAPWKRVMDSSLSKLIPQTCGTGVSVQRIRRCSESVSGEAMSFGPVRIRGHSIHEWPLVKSLRLLIAW